ncbi:hypothetical protein SERLADRAFT_390854 [Serpula lacrymans var. lacrymans S7.9]|uniref:Uncharacterized protein n=1 Tax=Serpula lacrymans var. lacrymans (strain S7.9) TaxID=578457 RepID=F8NVW4_SERL9|nr:uncharacterized protein SERLADRAFT_390854 [Serpula lacrymans var. lacrymans S7.9]EGO24898.1 hypothetical protein SERLADRAFT_390854 [Serpula lacrymans var. lacrymans S7.9]
MHSLKGKPVGLARDEYGRRAPSSAYINSGNTLTSGYEYQHPGRDCKNISPAGTDSRLSACRHSCSKDDDSDYDSPVHPVRPW